MRLQGKSALVTGGASGIGKATSLSFAKEGADVTIADINSNQGKEAVREIREKGGNASFTELDITKSADVDRTMRDVVLRCGKLDILFNSAGIPSRFSILNVTEEEWDRVIAVNLKGIFLCCKFAATHMVHSRNGSIINMGSVSSLVASRNILAYCASKGGVLMLSKAMACDLGQFGIRVNCICPSYVMTPIAESIMRRIPDPDQKIQAITQNYPLRRFAKPEEVASAAVFLASDEST